MKLTISQIKTLNRLCDERVAMLRLFMKEESPNYLSCGFCFVECDRCPAYDTIKDRDCFNARLQRSRDALRYGPKKYESTNAKKHLNNLLPLIKRWKRRYVYGKGICK